MKTIQWFILAFGFMIMGMIFISMDTFNPVECGHDARPLNTGDVWCVINAEMFDPFIWTFHILWILFIILGISEWFLSPKKKKH